MLPPLLTSTKEKQLELQRRCVHPEGTWKPFNWQNLTQTFPERIASQAEEHPDRLAVIDQSSSITYLELDQAANAVAEAILAEVEPGSGAVALLTGVDGPAVIGALGILKAGKIFAGLVESFPLHRHKQIIEDAEIRVIVADEPNMARAYELVGDKRTLFQLEKIPSIAAQLPLKPPTLDDPALLNYTSGTTGQPKGVIHSHRSRLAEAVRAFSTYHVCDADRITITKSLAWPGSFRILIGGLSLGACIATLDLRRFGVDTMVDWMHKIKPSIVTGLTEFREIVKTRPEESFPHVRVVRVGGNTVYRNDIEAFQNIFPNAMFANGLGLSEAGRVTEFLIEGDTLMEEEMLPLGYTLPGVTIRLLSTTGEFATSGDASSSESPSGIEVSPGEIGEVVIEDQYLADGYWHHSDLTAEKFRTLDNFNGARAYFTGDLAWQRTDGMLQHVGRMDDVIKIRGHQVFPNEIEALLRTVPGVNDVCVTGYSQSEGIMRLVAYLEAEHSDFHGVDSLYTKLVDLPDYMKPQSVVFIDEIPRTPSMKIDRQRLPVPQHSRINVSAEFLPPQNPIEEVLTAIWSEILQIDGIGIHDNFLELGGDSLTSTRIISKIRGIMDVKLNMHEAFSAVTIAEMAKLIERILDPMDEDDPFE